MSPTSSRIPGIDIARGLAVLGMVVVNYKIVLGASKEGSPLLIAMAQRFEGRASALFVLLAGLGLSIFSRQAREAGSREPRREARRIVLKRAVFLFIVGISYLPLWPGDILHFYGVYLALAAMLLFVEGRTLLALAVAVVVASSPLLVLFDYSKGWSWETLTYTDMWTTWGFLRHLFYNGFHPVIPWLAFLLFGLWLGRRDLRRRDVRRRMIWYGGVLALASEAAASGLMLLGARWMPGLAEEEVEAIFGATSMPPTPIYMLAAGATATAVLGLAIEASERWPGLWMRPLIASGQLALTLYFAHVVLGFPVLMALDHFEGSSLIDSLVASLIFWISGMIFAMLWLQHFRQGPLEMLMRKITK